MSEKRARNVSTAIISGSFSGTTSTLLLQPLDLLKTRIQINSRKRHDVLRKTFKEVLKNEKVIGLWKGTIPSLYRTVPGVGLYYGCLHLLDGRLREKPSNVKRFALGASARGFVVLCLMPVNVIKIRFESGKYHYKTVPKAFTYIWSTEGVRGLYRGSFTTIIRDAPFSGAYLMFYGRIKEIVKQSLGKEKLSSPSIAICGLTSGIFASLLTHPADVVKTLIQASSEPYKITAIIKNIFKNNGLQGFFKGFVPRALRRTLISAMSWTVYEKIMSIVGVK
ncbi:mitochondrial glycine transporter-like [Dendronephthya gigantea]|uniref:mitochondrial glycine transporter-like n=1 Tax=Dendronephthya gigantea TaxID=151771 RepID=UPI00106945EB|nr:mitochondrial glycine transporter-like [Dendronephthya gigantea]